MSKQLMSGRRCAGVLGLTLALVTLTAVPALAAKPIRERLGIEPLLLDAGSGCSFAVEVRPQEGSLLTRTEFSDGTVVVQAAARLTVTNTESGASIEVKGGSRYSENYDAETNDLLIEVSGQEILYFFPGDQGPEGEVGESGALYAVVGHVRETLDLDQDLITSFSLQGKAKELCSSLE